MINRSPKTSASEIRQIDFSPIGKPRGRSQEQIADDFADEIAEMMDILLGRENAPIALGFSTLMETADAYFARASEIEQYILRHERAGRVSRNTPLYKFRTGELRSFQEVARRAAELGSRRITVAQINERSQQSGLDTPRRGRSSGIT